MCGGVFIIAGIVNCNNAISLAFGIRGFLFFIFYFFNSENTKKPFKSRNICLVFMSNSVFSF